MVDQLQVQSLPSSSIRVTSAGEFRSFGALWLLLNCFALVSGLRLCLQIRIVRVFEVRFSFLTEVMSVDELSCGMERVR
jgi:hypothetical protein